MKWLASIFLSSLVLAILFSAPLASLAANQLPTYTLTVPLGTATQITGGPAEYLTTLYRFSLIFGTALAMLMIVVGAVRYTISAGNAGRQGDAKDQITSAVAGLALLLSAYLILSILNPRLVILQNPNVPPLPPPNPLGAAPRAPTNLTAILVSRPDYDFKLIWRDNADNETGFKIYGTAGPVGPNPARTELVLVHAANSGTGFVPPGNQPDDIPLPSSVTRNLGVISIYVTAYNGAGESSPSNTFALPQTPISRLVAPTNLTMVQQGSSNFLFRWTDNSNNPNEQEFCMYGALSNNDLYPIDCVGPNTTTLTVGRNQLSTPQGRLVRAFVRAQIDQPSSIRSDWSNPVVLP